MRKNKRALTKQCEKDTQPNRIMARDMIRRFPEGEIIKHQICKDQKSNNGGIPGGTVVKDPPANAGDTGSIPGLGRSHMQWSN